MSRQYSTSKGNGVVNTEQTLLQAVLSTVAELYAQCIVAGSRVTILFAERLPPAPTSQTTR
eukprot:m.90754 g.90754  ORF g.90754 m.90754 type:complete len:61 (+) comp11880_c0_seq3:421-603(+)